MSKTREWEKARAKLKKIYWRKGITTCELKREKCTNYIFLGFAHRHKREFYRTRPELLGSFDQTILACDNCHQEIEFDRELTEKEFEKLRGDEKETT